MQAANKIEENKFQTRTVWAFDLLNSSNTHRHIVDIYVTLMRYYVIHTW